jgi:uncharacterized membrane protein YccF (DUF307 family)
MATHESARQSGAAVEVVDIAEAADDLGAVLVLVALVQVASAFVGSVTGGLVGPLLGFLLTLAVASVPLAALARLYLDRPRRTERVLRGLGRVLVVVYVLWGVVVFGAWVFDEYLYAPAVLTSPVLGPPVAVAAFCLLPALAAVGVTVRVRRLEA